MTTVGILHPGAMGAAVGATLAAHGHEVLWCSEHRSLATARRAHDARMIDVGTIAALVERAEVILSICPPHAALEVAAGVAGYEGIYVDANAISPQTARTVSARVPRYVDASIIGPPPRQPRTTRLYLSGPDATYVTPLFAKTWLEPIVVPDASALKMAYAAWTKGTAALLIALLRTARHHGVEEELRNEWARSQPDLEQRASAATRAADDKAWRWEEEMREIARTFAAASQPIGFHVAAAEIYGATGRRSAPPSSS